MAANPGILPNDPLVVRGMKIFKAQLLNEEALQMAQMAQRWLEVEDSLTEQIDALAEKIKELSDAGQTISQAMLFRMDRYRELLAQAQAEFAVYADYSDDLITRRQKAMAERGITNAVQATTLASYPNVPATFTRLPVEAVEYMVGHVGDGSPLGTYLRGAMVKSPGGVPLPGVIQRINRNLITASAEGWNPRKTARQLRDDFAEGINPALRTARTEQLRVYRQASIEQYRGSGLVTSFKRLSAHDDRVCPACIAADGELYDVMTDLDEHVQGRCTMVPVVKGMAVPTWTNGEAWLKTQDEATQRRVLGKSRFELWKSGEVPFKAFGEREPNSVWGASRKVVPVKDLTDS